jgi:hypothetical protein
MGTLADRVAERRLSSQFANRQITPTVGHAMRSRAAQTTGPDRGWDCSRIALLRSGYFEDCPLGLGDPAGVVTGRPVSGFVGVPPA